MKNIIRNRTFKILAIIASIIIGISSLLIGLNFSGLLRRRGRAYNTVFQITVNEMWNSTNSKFKEDEFNNLLKAISGDQNVSVTKMDKIKTMATARTTSTTMKSNNGKEIVITLGGFTWTPTYLSTDKNGNIILTLWLANTSELYNRTYGDGQKFDRYGPVKWASFSDSSTSGTYPSSMYGTSYIRSVVLNNGGSYATSISATQNFDKKDNSCFAPFTYPKDGAFNDITDFIVTPENVSWQESQSAKTTLNYTNNLPNESWSNSVGDSGFSSSAYNFAHKTDNENWKSDYLWLPSFTEVGEDDSTGLWQTTIEQRRCYSRVWLRSGSNTKAEQVCTLSTTSSKGTTLIKASNTKEYSVCPAFHLNLSAIATQLTMIEELWDNSIPSAPKFNLTNLNNLITAISGKSTYSVFDMSGIDTMAKNKTTSKTMQENHGGTEIVVSLGGLLWTPTYLSQDENGNAILTLWLENSSQLSGKVYNKSGNQFDKEATAQWNIYNTYSYTTYPSNMYGTSYMRCVVLNNGGNYATNATTLYTGYSKISNSVFSPFTYGQSGEDITDYIVTPQNVSWQKNGEFASQCGEAYNLSNENWGYVSDSGFFINYYSTTGYDNWKSDYLWLPSYSEIGYYSTSFKKNYGIWEISLEQKYKNDVKRTWLRSAYNNNYKAYGIDDSANDTFANYVTDAYSVRPALHLNLDAAAISATQTEVSLLSGYGSNSQLGTVTTKYKQTMGKVSVPTRSGYTFNGYFTGMNGGGRKYFNKDGSCYQAWNEQGVTQLYASWEQETYSIRFIGNGGTINSKKENTSTVKYNESITIIVDRPGYKFNYFTKEQNPTSNSTTYSLSGNQFKVTIDFGENGVEVPMYAQWTTQKYNITYDAGGKILTGGTSLPSSATLSYDDTGGTSYTIPSNTPKTTGYEFSGWANIVNGKTYTPGQQVAIKDLFNISTQEGVYNISDIKLTAIWTPIKYKIKFNENTKDIKNKDLLTSPTGSASITGASLSNGLYTLTYDEEYYIDNNYVCNGYNFLGFRTNAGTTGTLYKNKDILLNLTDVSKQEYTFYAQWEPTWSKFAYIDSSKPVQQGSTYLIQSAENLGWLMGTISFGSTELKNSINSPMYTFKQTRNIYLTDYPWSPDGEFASKYDGNGCHIYNLHTETDDNKGIIASNNTGLFAETNGAILKNITIMSGNIVGADNVGSFVGASTNTLIQNCVNSANVSGNTNVGGIVGKRNETVSTNASATVTNCINYGKVDGNSAVGGLIGNISNSTIDACYVRANVNGSSNTGGLIGTGTSVTIKNSAYVENTTTPSSVNWVAGSMTGGEVCDCLIKTLGAEISFPSNATNCVGYVNNGTPKTSQPTATMSYANWTTVNGQWFPKGLTWLA